MTLDQNFEFGEFQAADGIDLGEEPGVENSKCALLAYRPMRRSRSRNRGFCRKVSHFGSL